ncbi:hypothetical protein E4P40_20475 [Blastococcus sp. CT_GayMR20]|uniref:hypothetical protein n=1 Tax=Blastococcus sp. CT_GayMR20 TaxID=2559609 RepID=UPI001073A041|nr:hypothetical protein [Blastococcus sp. CT_GayMR20]TFV72488.1 hypothetical protein E4P40_20475 [Blastococcus sp. CT_GayMR20]
MLQLAGVLITAVVTLLTSLGWPSLRRRVREHTALVKDLPPSAAAPLLAVLEKEVQLLARRADRRLETADTTARYFFAVTLMVTVGTCALLATWLLDLSRTPNLILTSAAVVLALIAGGLLARIRFLLRDSEPLRSDAFHVNVPETKPHSHAG